MKRRKKAGRKRKPYVAANGDTINGLSRVKDGRWRVIGTQIRFTEPDAQRAIDRFRELSDGWPIKELGPKPPIPIGRVH